jgi:hypothetical protein
MSFPVLEEIVFDRVVVDRVHPGVRLGSGWWRFRVDIRNDGQGPDEAATVPVEASEYAVERLGAQLRGWLVECVARRGRAYPNDGHKVRSLLLEAPLRFDDAYIAE